MKICEYQRKDYKINENTLRDLNALRNTFCIVLCTLKIFDNENVLSIGTIAWTFEKKNLQRWQDRLPRDPHYARSHVLPTF